MTFFRKIGAGYHQLYDDFLLKKVLQDVEPVDISSSDNLFCFSHRTSSFYLKVYALIAHALSKKGYPSCFLFRDCIVDHYFPTIENTTEKIDLSNLLTIRSFEIGSYFPNLIIDGKEISDSLVEVVSKIKITDGKKRSLKYDWDVDLEDGIVKTKDVNFFPLIRTTLRAIFKRYNIDFADDRIVKFSNDMINSSDLLLDYFLLLKKFAYVNDMHVRIVGWEYNYIPNGFFRLLCDSLSVNRDIEYIELSRGYKHYFGCPNTHSYVCSVNFTRSKFENKNSISKEKILNEIKKIDRNELFKPIEEKVKKVKKTHNLNDNQKHILHICNDFLQNGKHVFVLFAHIFYDNPIFDTSAAFHDMCNWIKYTIDIFKSSDDLLILKPHPKEIRSNPEKNPNETLESFINENYDDLPDNILLLKPMDFKLYDLFTYITCGLIWKSSASNELTYMGKPCIISGPSPFKQALDDLYYTKNKEHYVSLIKNVDKLRVAEKHKLKIAAYIHVLSTKDIEIRQMDYNSDFRTAWLNHNKIFGYIKNGDRLINKIVDDMIKS